jgi:hypothetical protein
VNAGARKIGRNALKPKGLEQTHAIRFKGSEPVIAASHGPFSRGGAPRRGRYALESVAPEVASFGFGITIIEQGGARTEFHDGGARVAKLMPMYDQTPADSFLRMLDPKNGLAPGDPDRMAARASLRASTWSPRRCGW